MKTVYILFQTDIHKTRSSRVFCGVFPSEDSAKVAAIKNHLFSIDTDVDIVPCEVGKFEEL